MVSNRAHPCSGENIRYHDHENTGVPPATDRGSGAEGPAQGIEATNVPAGAHAGSMPCQAQSL